MGGIPANAEDGPHMRDKVSEVERPKNEFHYGGMKSI